MRIRPVLPVVVLLALLTGCVASPGPDGQTPSPDPTPDPVAGFSIESLLAQVPAIQGNVLISVGDVAAASDVVGTPRPTAPGDDFVDWMITTSGMHAGSAVSLPWPSSLGQLWVSSHEDYIAAVGFGIPDVDVFLEVSAPPSTFTLVDGRFDTAAVTAALGDPVDGIWAQPGAELAPVLDARGAPDDLGRPVRVAGDDARLVMSLQRGLVTAYLDGVTGDWGALVDAARVLDEEGVYAAQLWRDDEAVRAVGLVAGPDGSEPIAVSIDLGRTATPPEVGATEGPFTVSAVESDDAVTVIRLSWSDDTPPLSVWQLLATRSVLFGR